jgi:hypothetical protein
MMNRSPLKSARVQLPALLAACVALLNSASCGRADSSRVDSETHWLVSCESDLDCGAGSCECGVCTETCVTTSDCAGAGVAGVECAPLSGACGESGAGAAGAASAVGGACLLSCVEDADCAALAADAVCERQRCEQPPRASVSESGGASGSGGTGSAGGASAVAGSGGQAASSGESAAGALCDGSDGVRFVWLVGGGFVDSYYAFTANRGVRFLAIDGSCRFWRSTGPSGTVSSGTLTAENAAAFASTLNYERVLDIGSYEDPPTCTDGATSVIWTPDSRITCSCGPCSDSPDAPSGWSIAFRTMSDARLDEWFANAQPSTGPARLALVDLVERPPMFEPLAWPLAREPRDSEVSTSFPDESSGAEITDPDELTLLRESRATYAERVPIANFTPLLYSGIGAEDALVFFHMLLRDELPEPVDAALGAASGVP